MRVSETPLNAGAIAAVLSLASAMLFAAIGFTQDGQPSAEQHYVDAIKKLHEAVSHEVAHKELPALSIAVVDNDRVVWSAGFGFQDADQDQPATSKTVYRVGSISKLLTDLRVMQLVELGKLDLDASIATYLPDFQPENQYGVPITLRQMMSHRSGLVRESPVGNYFDPTEPSLQATVESLNQTRLVYQPDTKTKYSNAAIAVVGAVIESVTPESHPDQVRRTILDPLQMDGSGFVVTPAIDDRLATGWMRTYDGRRPFPAPDFLLGTGPAGNLYSSVDDLSKFVMCLFDEGKVGQVALVSPDTYQQMITPLKDDNGDSLGFGIGFHVGEFDGHAKIGHGGAVYGFSTQLAALPERRIGVIVASALDGTNGVSDRLASYALRLVIASQDGMPLPDYPTTIPVSSQRAAELVGTYLEVDGDRTTEINQLGKRLYMLRGTYRRELAAESKTGRIVTDDEFGYGLEVKLRNGKTLVVGETSFERVADEPPDACPARWQGLIGEYGWDHNTLYILEDRGRLFALIEWFYYYPLTESDQDTYDFPGYGLYHGEGLRFVRDREGIAQSVVAAEVEFERRNIGTAAGETFKIDPVRPIESLRVEALAASPRAENGDYRESDLVELTEIDPTIQLDIRYASTNNFTGSVFYRQPRAFMQQPAAEAVANAHDRLKQRGLGLLVHDAYRPWYVTKMFWDATPDSMKDFVANPANGSRHNRGCAVDITLFDLASGKPIQMVAGYDEFSQRAFPLYPGGTARQRWYRDLLRRTLEPEGFTVYEYEWWHFDYRDWRKYRIGNVTFDKIQPSASAE